MARRIIIIVVFLLGTQLRAQTSQPSTRIKTIEVEIPTQVWPGWERGTIDEDPNAATTKVDQEQYTSFPTPAGQPPTFSGKVVGLDSFNDVEVAVITVVPREYFSHNAYVTALVRADGSFSLRSQDHLDLAKTICVRAPGRPWTYLRHDFPPGQSGRDIVLRADEGKKVTVSARRQGGPEKSFVTVEAFDGYQRRDNEGKAVQSAYYGGHDSSDGTSWVMLPLRPMALRIRADGSANSFVMVDPREVDQLIVILPSEARVHARIIKSGQNFKFHTVWFFNPAARLSWGGVETNEEGVFELRGLMPGEYIFIVDGQNFSTVLKQGRTNDVSFTVMP
jgi:hypothetical protein